MGRDGAWAGGVHAGAGVLPDAAIQALCDAGHVTGVADPSQVQPASLDLVLGRKAHRVRASFLPGAGVRVAEGAEALSFNAMDLRDGAVLEPGAVYLVEARERFSLPAGVSARANPKSSTGRIDVFVRILGDGSERYDDLPAGYRGPVWMEVMPLTFPVVVREGTRLAQVRFRSGDTRMDDAALRSAHSEDACVVGQEPHIGDGLLFSVDLSPEGDDVVGWRARRHAGVVDADLVGTLPAGDYWEAVSTRRGPSGRHGLVLDPGEFYILASRERIRIPRGLAAEMVPFDPGYGELRAHYAGFFDPGFGVDRESRAVLEVRSHQVPFLLEDGQVVGKLLFERMAAPPDRSYGAQMSSNYDGQRLKLSKHFR